MAGKRRRVSCKSCTFLLEVLVGHVTGWKKNRDITFKSNTFCFVRSATSRINSEEGQAHLPSPEPCHGDALRLVLFENAPRSHQGPIRLPNACLVVGRCVCFASPMSGELLRVSARSPRPNQSRGASASARAFELHLSR